MKAKNYKFDENKIYYVYEWFNVDTGYIFYVGKGCKDRYQEKSYGDRNRHFMEYYNNNKCDKRKVFENLDERTACELEDSRIKKLKSEGQCCANILNGTSCGGRLYGKDNGFYGKTFSPEIIERLRKINSDGRNKGENNSQYGISPRERMDDKTYAGWLEKQHLNKIGGRNPKARKVIMIKDEEIKEFDSISLCAEYIKEFLGLERDVKAISKSLLEKLRLGTKYLGYIFYYKDEHRNNKNIVKKGLFLDKNLLNSLNDAAKVKGITATELIKKIINEYETGFEKNRYKTTYRVQKVLRIDRNIIEKAEKIAKENKVSFSNFVYTLIKQYLEKNKE